MSVVELLIECLESNAHSNRVLTNVSSEIAKMRSICSFLANVSSKIAKLSFRDDCLEFCSINFENDF